LKTLAFHKYSYPAEGLFISIYQIGRATAL
jgi:hypothetical protein